MPGSGKTTLGRALAQELDVAFISKDVIKEALYDALGTGDVEWSERLGAASHQVMYALAKDARAAVLEAHFYRGVAEGDLQGLGHPMIQVYCRCPLEVAEERYFARVSAPDRHWGHLPEHQTPETIAGWRNREPRPLALDAPLIEVDTAGPVDVPAIAGEIRANWA